LPAPRGHLRAHPEDAARAVRRRRRRDPRPHHGRRLRRAVPPRPAGADQLTPTTGTVLPGPTAGTPRRRPGSVRRTATIDMGWPGGTGGPLELVGRARDLLTRAGGEPVVLDEA